MSGVAELKAFVSTAKEKKKIASLFQSVWEDKSASLHFFEVERNICLLLLLYPVRKMHFLVCGGGGRCWFKKK